MQGKIVRASEIIRNKGFISLINASKKFFVRELKAHYYQRKKYRYKITNSDSIANPYKIIPINPRTINYITPPQFQQNVPSNNTYIIGGDWDQPDENDDGLMFYNKYEDKFEERKARSLNNYCFYQSIENHIQNRIPWYETDFHKWVTATDKLPKHSFYAKEDTRKWRYNQIDKLYLSMKKEGYKLQEECDRGSSIMSRDKRAGDISHTQEIPPEYHEVMINIGRDGRLYFEEGRHRFAVARSLGLKSIPVRVLVRHPQWQKKRSKIARATNPAAVPDEMIDYLSHPDMADIL